jgi:Tfp pilus assembly protein FimT
LSLAAGISNLLPVMQLTVSRTTKAMHASKSSKLSSGYTLMELAIVIFMMMVMVAIAIPNGIEMLRTNRLTGDARGLERQLSLARQRAGAEFTWTKIVIDTTTTPVSFTLQLCTTKATSSCTTYSTEGGTQYLSTTTTLGFGNSSGAAGGQTTRAQTTTVIFNSRGIPIDSTGAPIATDTIYLTNTGNNACAVSLTLSGHVNVWRYSGGWVQL